MNKMLNTATSMAYHNKSSSSSSSYMTPVIRRNLRRGSNNDDNVYSNDLIGADYFVSSLDFEYDLFLNGLVNCDNSGYRNRIQHHKDLYDSSFSDTNENNQRDEMTYVSTRNLESNQMKIQDCSSSSLLLNNTESLFFALNSPLSRAATAYRHLQKSQRQHAISNDYTSLPFGKTNNNISSNNNNSHNLSSQLNSNQTTSTILNNTTNNGKNNKLTSNGAVGYANPLGNSKSNNLAINGNTGTTINNASTCHINYLQNNNETNLNQKTVMTTTTPTSGIDVDPSSQSMLDENIDISDNLSHQHLHALHRFRQQRKKGLISRLRDVVISFTPKARGSVVNSNDIYLRYGKEEKDTLSAFDFLANEDDIVKPMTQQDVTEPIKTYDHFEIDLQMEEYDLIYPFNCDTDIATMVENDEVNKKLANQSNNKSNDVLNSLEIQRQYSNSNCNSEGGYDQFYSTSPIDSTLKTNHHHSTKLQKFRFGFPRKSNSLEFQTSMKRLNDDEESISGSQSVQEALTGNNNNNNNIVKSTKSNYNKGRCNTGRYFLNSNFSPIPNNQKKKNRSKKKSKKMTTATNIVTTIVAE